MKSLNGLVILMTMMIPTVFFVSSLSALDDLSLNVAGGPVVVAPGDTVTVTLDITNLFEAIDGVQAFMRFDSTVLRLDAIDPNTTIGGVGWTEAIENEGAGDIDYVVVMNAAGASTAADHTIATLTFTAMAEGTSNVAFRPDSPPVFTRLTSAATNSGILPNQFDSLAIVVSNAPRVSNLEVFYAGRFGDAANRSRSFLAAGSIASLSNITNYVRGITGIRVTFDRLITFATTADAAFFLDWTTATGTVFSPLVDPGAAVFVSAVDVGGVTVVSVALNDDLVRRRWLRVTIDATQVTSLGTQMDGELTGNPVLLPSGNAVAGGNAEFFLGNLTADVDGDRRTTLDDMVQVRAEVNPFLGVSIGNLFDVNKDQKVTLDDMIQTRADVNPFFLLPLIAP